MKKLIMILLLIFISTYSYAQVVIEIDPSGMTQMQKNFIKAVAYHIAYDNGENVVPTIRKENGKAILTFDSLTQETADKITKANILIKYQELKQAREAAQAQEESDKTAMRISIINKLKTILGLTNEEIRYMFPRFDDS